MLMLKDRRFICTVGVLGLTQWASAQAQGGDSEIPRSSDTVYTCSMQGKPVIELNLSSGRFLMAGRSGSLKTSTIKELTTPLGYTVTFEFDDPSFGQGYYPVVQSGTVTIGK